MPESSESEHVVTETVAEALDKVEETITDATETVTEAAKETHNEGLGELKSLLLGLQSTVNDLTAHVARIADAQVHTSTDIIDDATNDIAASTEQAAQAVETVTNDIKPSKAKKRIGKRK